MKSESRLMKTLNSPIVITVVILTALPLVLGLAESYRIKMLAGQIKKELKEFVSDKGELKEIASDVSGQIVEGVKQGFSSSGDDGEIEKYTEFTSVKNALFVSDIKYAHSGWSMKEKIIGIIRNDSDRTIRNINLTVSYLDRDGELMDVGKEWLSDIKYLGPGESAPFTFMRDLGDHDEDKEVLNSRKSHEVSIQLANFVILKEEKEEGQKK